MKNIPHQLLKKIKDRKEKEALRQLPPPNDLIDFSSNDYLGFAKSEIMFKMATQILDEKKIVQNGATGSRLLTGNHVLYDEVETMLTDFHNSEAALVFNSGYDANIGFFSSVPQRGDIVLYDEYIHASIRDGIQMGHAKAYKFKHNDLKDLRQLLERFCQTEPVEVYIVTESIFSMDGDSPNLLKLTDLAEEYGAFLVVDEAHAVGVFGDKGEGLVQVFGLQDRVFARIVTFGKALGCHGAAVLGSNELKDYLVNFARSFVFTTGLPPHSLATVKAAYGYLNMMFGEVGRLNGNIQFFRLKLQALNLEHYFIQSYSAVHCCVIQGNEKVKSIAARLQQRGFDVKPILSPTVPEGQERLRFCLHNYNAEQDILNVLKTLKEALDNFPLPLERV